MNPNSNRNRHTLHRKAEEHHAFSGMAGMAAMAAIAAATCVAITASAEAYTWTGAASGTWNTSAQNWTNSSGQATGWVNGNNAIFPAAGANKTITVENDVSVGAITIGSSGYTFAGSGLISASGKVTLSDSATFNPARFGGSSVRIGGSSNKTLTFWGSTSGGQSLTILEDSIIFVPNNDTCFGAVPSSATENIRISSGQPGLNLNADNLKLNANRSITVASGATLRLCTAKKGTAIGSTIGAAKDATLGYATNSVLYVPNMWSWSGNTALDPGAGRTNDVGRLRVENNLALNSGTTRVGASAIGATGSSAPLNVTHGGSPSDFSADHGNLVVRNGATLYCSQGDRYAEVAGYGQITVTNGGAIYMPNIQFTLGNTTSGNNGPGRLTVADGGKVTVGDLRVSHSTAAKPSEINLNEGGTIAANSLGIDSGTGKKCVFTFNGGRLQARSWHNASSPFFKKTGGSDLTEEMLSGIVFKVAAKGAVFDVSDSGGYSKIWWNRPLTSGTASDGGIRADGGASSGELIMMAANTYNGATTVSNAQLTIQADYALPSGTALNLVGGTVEMRNYGASPARNMTNALARIAGYGTVKHPEFLSVTGSIAPDAGKTIEFTDNKLRSLGGNFELRAKATGCGCVKLSKSQNISGLTLVPVDIAALDSSAPRGTYKILDAPSGFTGEFRVGAGFPSDKWKVRYTSTAAYIEAIGTTMIIMR